MRGQWDSSLSVLPVARVQFPTMAEYFKGLYTVQGVPKSGVAPPWKKPFSLMKIMRCLRISLVYGKEEKQ